jgi:hypothetical protein
LNSIVPLGISVISLCVELAVFPSTILAPLASDLFYFGGRKNSQQ